MTRLLGLIAAFLVAAAAPALAAGDDWVITKASGEVFVQSVGATYIAVSTAGGRVAPGSVILTSASGRVMLTRGRETMVVSPNSIIGIPAGTNGQFTTILERTGEVEFEVEKGNVQHFAVETPYLAAIVKGTHFTVRASQGVATVSVDRGRVQVDAFAAGKSVDVVPGQRATVTKDGLSVAGGGERAPIVPLAPRAPVVEPYTGTLEAAKPLGTTGTAIALGAVPTAPGGAVVTFAASGGKAGSGTGGFGLGGFGLGGGPGNAGQNAGQGNGGQDNGNGNAGNQGGGNDDHGQGHGGGDDDHGGGRGRGD